MDVQQENTASSIVFRGMYILGAGANVVDEESATIAPFILLGKYDKELKYFFYWRETKQYPQSEEQVNTPAVLRTLENAKSYIRWQIQSIIDRENDQIVKERKQQFGQMVADMKDSSKPHPLGTVAQLATRFNISKSEVRRMRTAGTLDQFLNEKLGITNE